MKKIILPVALGLALVATSCQNKLEIPQKGVLTAEEFYSSDADAQALLTNMYVSLFGSHGIAGTEGIYNNQLMLFNYSSDDVLAAGGDAEDHGDFRVFDEFRYDNANGPLKNLYSGYANSIFTANLVISNFSNENIDGSEPKYSSNFTKACVEEARVLRAYMHLMMALAYNTPCIVDRLLDPSELPVQASSQSEVLQWVIAECEKAISSGLLIKDGGKSDKDATARMTRGFAQFVAGKAAMYNHDSATARKYLGALIDEGSYSLVPSEDFWTLFHAAGDGNEEIIFAPNFIEDSNFSGFNVTQRGRWMVADVLCWRTDALASTPTVCQKLPSAGGGWNGGAIQEDFAKKFLAHDGNSPRRKATFITEDEFLYEMDWSASTVNDGTLAEKKKDDKRGIKNTAGVYSHSNFFEWKNMVYHNVPKLLAGDKASSYPGDALTTSANSNTHNLTMARYAEALLLYAEACIGSSDEAKGLAALNAVQERSGSGKISSSLTLADVMEEKQYELWFEGTRFTDLVRWASEGKVNLDDIFNKSGFHDRIPIVTDTYFTDKTPEHKLSVSYVKAHYSPFEVGKHEYFPIPRDMKISNPNLKDVLGWAYLNQD